MGDDKESDYSCSDECVVRKVETEVEGVVEESVKWGIEGAAVSVFTELRASFLVSEVVRIGVLSRGEVGPLAGLQHLTPDFPFNSL